MSTASKRFQEVEKSGKFILIEGIDYIPPPHTPIPPPPTKTWDRYTHEKEANATAPP